MGYKIQNLPFRPDFGANQLVYAGSVSASIQINKDSRNVRIVNQGLQIGYLRIGNSAVVATTADIPIRTNESLIIEKDTEQTHIAFISASGTVLNIQTGQSTNNTIYTTTDYLPLNYNPKMWFDASDAQTITESSNLVSAWADKSGYDNHATQSTDGNKPTYSANNLAFDGGDFLNLWDSTANSSFVGFGETFTIFIVLKADAITGTSAIAWGPKYTVFEMRNLNQVACNIGIDNSKTHFGVTDNYIAGAEEIVGSTALNTSNAYIHQITMNGDDYQVFINGVSDASGTLATATGNRNITSSTIGAQIGCRRRDGGQADTDFFDGDIKEIIVYDTFLSTANRTIINNYLTTKWL